MDIKELLNIFSDIEDVAIEAVGGSIVLVKSVISFYDFDHGCFSKTSKQYPEYCKFQKENINSNSLIFELDDYESIEVILSNICKILMSEFEIRFSYLLDNEEDKNDLKSNLDWAYNIIGKYIK